MNVKFLFLLLFFSNFLSTGVNASELDDEKRLQAVARAVTSLEAAGEQLGTYALTGAGHKGSGLGWFHFQGGGYSNSIANKLVALGYLTLPVPKDPKHPQPGSFSSYDFLVYRCLDRVAVFSKADDITPAFEHQSWWQNNNCTQYPINTHDHTYFVLSRPVQSQDERRVEAVTRTVAALETAGEQLGTYALPGSGYNGSGLGWLHYQGGAYSISIANTLVDLGYLTPPVPKDPNHPQPGNFSSYDFLVYRCRERVAVFSKADNITPTSNDQSWWQSNNCNQYPFDTLDHTYFILSKPVRSADEQRVEAVSRAVTALEAAGEQLGSYTLPGSGSNGTGLGWFHYQGNGYSNSIANSLVTLGHLSTPVPKDPRHPKPGIYSSYDFLVYRCRNRVAVFSKADSITPSLEHQNWWQRNNCNQYPFDTHDHSYFVLSNPSPADSGPVPNLSQYDLVFSDEFNASPGSKLDQTKWDTGMLWGPYVNINNEEQMYVDSLGMHSAFSHSPFEFTGSTLKINATPTSPSLQPPPRPSDINDPIWKPRPYSEYRFNGPSVSGPGYQPEDVNYLSGILTTYGSLKMTHGYVEMRAKFPTGEGLWSALWMSKVHYNGTFPELGIAEVLGDEPGRIDHYYNYFDNETNESVTTPPFATISSDWTQDFHTVGMAWSPTEIIWYVNGNESRRVSSDEYSIANQSMFIMANLAVGGNYPGAPGPSTVFPATFEIDYIRAYKRKLNPQLDLANDYQLMFEDNFNGSTLDASKWNTSFLWGPYLPINNEKQYLVDALGSDSANVTLSNTPFVVDNGRLSIIAREKTDPNSFPIPNALPGINDPIWTNYQQYNQNSNYSPGDYTSGIITSYNSFKFVQGYVETRARIPQGRGLWPAFWLLNSYYVGQQPEIDIFEILGDKPYRAYQTFHRPDAFGSPLQTQGIIDYGSTNPGYADGFHVYGMRWQHDRIDWYIDGNIVFTYQGDDVPYQSMYVLADIAVGGVGSWPGPPDNSTNFPVQMDIDYIRVYQERHKED